MARRGGAEGRRALQVSVLGRWHVQRPVVGKLDEPQLEQHRKQAPGNSRGTIAERGVQRDAVAQGAIGAGEAGAQREVSIQDIPAARPLQSRGVTSSRA